MPLNCVVLFYYLNFTKTHRFYSLTGIIAAIFLYACQKDVQINKQAGCVEVEQITSVDSSFYIYYSGTEENGFAMAIKLNKNWRASATTSFFNNFYTLRLTTVISKDELNYKTEAIEFTFNKPEIGCYRVTNRLDSTGTVQSNYQALDDDVIEDAYSVLEGNASNFLQIDTLDPVSRRLSGKFMVSYKKEDRGTTKKYNPDFVRFLNGEFHADINW